MIRLLVEALIQSDPMRWNRTGMRTVILIKTDQS
jgi:hypothetical protein